MIRFRCHKCTRKIAIPDGSAGKALRCPSCNTLNQAPNPYDPDSEHEIRSEEVRISKLERLEVHKASGRVSKADYEHIKRKLTEMDFGLPITEEELAEQQRERQEREDERKSRRRHRGDERDEEGVDIYDDTTSVYDEEEGAIYDEQPDEEFEEFEELSDDEYEEEYDFEEEEDALDFEDEAAAEDEDPAEKTVKHEAPADQAEEDDFFVGGQDEDYDDDDDPLGDLARAFD